MTPREVRLIQALLRVRHDSLLDVRRAAFSPEIGVRYSEAIRSEISAACWRLELYIERVLAEEREIILALD